MSIADKLAIIAENEQKVYDAGKTKGAESINIPLAQKNNSLEAVLFGGESEAKSWYDKFWDNFQNYGNRRAYNYAFYGADRKWGDTFAPKYDLVIENANYLFMYNSGTGLNLKEGLAKNNVRFDMSVCTRATACFSYSDIGDLPELNLTSYPAIQVMFQGCKSKIIDKIILKDDGSQTFNSTFDGYADLEEVRFEGVIGQNMDIHWSTKLTHESLMSIIEHFATVSTTRTLTLGTANLAKLTDTEKAIATEKGWTLT